MADIEALEQLKRVVSETPDSDFNMSYWACGTVGCAFGRAAMDPWFNAKGLRLVYDVKTQVLVPILGEAPSGIFGTYAACSIFDIPLHTAELIILSMYYEMRPITRAHVVERIDSVITEHGGASHG